MIRPDPNCGCAMVAQAARLGCARPVFSFSLYPELAQCWLDRARRLIAQHTQMTPAERARAIRECDIYSGAPLPKSYFRTIRRRGSVR